MNNLALCAAALLMVGLLLPPLGLALLACYLGAGAVALACPIRGGLK